ncbi:MAG: hypothetical protein DMG89_23395 [Acidobacteria bacterium]|nr:MAG: hypothetical protein DMG89_23395 [Acidobacteriota bacterium]
MIPKQVNLLRRGYESQDQPEEQDSTAQSNHDFTQKIWSHQLVSSHRNTSSLARALARKLTSFEDHFSSGDMADFAWRTTGEIATLVKWTRDEREFS